MSQWGRCKLSLKGKMIVLNTMVASKVTPLAFVVPLPNLAQLNKIEVAISNFFWGENKPKLSRVLSQQKIKKGGLGQINLTAKLKAI